MLLFCVSGRVGTRGVLNLVVLLPDMSMCVLWLLHLVHLVFAAGLVQHVYRQVCRCTRMCGVDVLAFA